MIIKVGDKLLIKHVDYGSGEALVTKLTENSTRGRVIYFTLGGLTWSLNGSQFKDALEAANPRMFETPVDEIDL